MNTLLLDVGTWDLTLDANGNIALATGPYALAQDVASAIRTFLGEVYYDTSLGVPYTQQILGQRPPLSLLQDAIAAAALTVPGVVAASVVIQSFENRVVIGSCNFTDTNGNSQTVGI